MSSEPGFVKIQHGKIQSKMEIKPFQKIVTSKLSIEMSLKGLSVKYLQFWLNFVNLASLRSAIFSDN